MDVESRQNEQREIRTDINRLGFYVSVATVVVTVITFAIAFLTPPLSGPFCTGDCFEYPYTDVASRFPRDYFWMYPAMLWALLYVVLMVCIHYYAPASKKIFSMSGLCFGAVGAAVLFIDYFVQVSVIQPGLLKGETEGIALLSQYNPHGVFIALEEIGYLLIAVSFIFIAPVFPAGALLERSLRWTFVVGFFLVIISLVLVCARYGIQREYRFEIAVISLDWIVMIVAGILLARIFYKGIGNYF